jgi:hypothetical protein
MSTVYLLSHGDYTESYGETFVPSGRSISFYCDEGEGTLALVALAVVYGNVPPRQTYAGGDVLPNYALSAFNDPDYEDDYRRVGAVRRLGRLCFVGIDLGSPLWLCSTPQVCEGQRAELAASGEPVRHHDGCAGVFALVGETEILSVACRVRTGTPAGDVTYTWEMGGHDDEFAIDNVVEAERIVTWAGTEPDAAMQYFLSLSETTRIMLMTHERLKTWVRSQAAPHH